MKKLTFALLLTFGLVACKEGAKAPAEKPAEMKAAAKKEAPAPKKAASQPAKKAEAVVPGNTPGTREHIDDDGVVRRGEKLSPREHLSVALTMAKLSELEGKPVKVTGTVGKVCVKKGCWFVLEEGEQKIRITSKGYKFFVPSKSIGMMATVEGELKVTQLSKDDAEHLAAEGAPVQADAKEVSIAAVGVELKKKEG
ncbi:MAG: DUF4920 domain-containing protein [Deltaproteobacteria bacterium]